MRDCALVVGSRGQYSYFENSSCFAMIGGLSLMIFVFAAIVMLQSDDEKRSCPALPCLPRLVGPALEGRF